MTTAARPSSSRLAASMTSPTTARVRAEALLHRAGSSRARSGLAAAASRTLLLRLLARMTSDRLDVIDLDGSRHVFGWPDGPRIGSAPDEYGVGASDPEGEMLKATLEILDERAWTAVITEGSIGLGRGYVEGWWASDDPTALVRIIIRNLRHLDELRNRVESVTGGFGNRIRRALPRPNRATNREDIASHYDLGNEFFELFLDETMTYSSAVFTDPTTDLSAASEAKYDRLLAKLGVTAEHHVLEIGTGWGGFARRAAETVGCRVTTTTLSAEQQREAESRISAAGLDDRVTVLGRDWRDLTGQFDRIVSIEMIEAVDWRDYNRFFATIDRCLAPDGLVGLQAICVPERRYERTKKTEDFIRRFVFPGGFLPSIGAIIRATARVGTLQLIDLEDSSHHYAETLRRWRIRFDEHLPAVEALGLDERFCRLWRFYLCYCEAGFLERHCTVNQIVLAGPDWRPDGLTLRPH